MKIKYRIIIQFTLLISAILLIFSIIIFYSTRAEKKKNFFQRLEKRSATTANLLQDYKTITPELLDVIDKNSLSRLPNEEVAIYDFNYKLLYSHSQIYDNRINKDFLHSIEKNKKVYLYKDYKATVGYIFQKGDSHLIVVTSAVDLISKSDNYILMKILVLGNCLGILLTVLLGYLFAYRTLVPVQNINSKIKEITTHSQKERLPVSKNKDEINELSSNFNAMLERLEYSFYQQRNFISHASHQLKTPLSSMKTEIQIGLLEDYTIKEYKEMLENLLIDTERLIDLSGSILRLGKPYEAVHFILDDHFFVKDIIEEIIEKNKKIFEDRIRINDDNDNRKLILGNRTLVEHLFFNILENSIKYSIHDVIITIRYSKKECIVNITDSGIGIPIKDIQNIFNPFFRSDNVNQYQGFGIGLSVCKNIADLHKAKIHVESLEGKGTSFIIIFPLNI